MPTLEKFRGEIYLWHYIPSLAAAAVFAVVFGLLTIAHTWKMVRARMWFCLPFVIGGLFEVIGYAARAAAPNKTGILLPYLIQSIFLLLPPVLFAASLYMTFSRLIQSVSGTKFSPVTPRWSTRIFVSGDVLCLLMQSSGAGLLAQSDNSSMGDKIIVGGLGIQILIFTGFFICCVLFHRRFQAHAHHVAVASHVPWRQCLRMLYATSVLISARNIYRLVEYIMGSDSYLFTVEWPVYVLDGVLMLFVMVTFYVWYPDQLKIIRGEFMAELSNETIVTEESARDAKH